MKIIHATIVILLATLISSCIKFNDDPKEEAITTGTYSPVVGAQLDQDFDGISDDEEIKLGTNPRIAEWADAFIPQIKSFYAGGRIRQVVNGVTESAEHTLKTEYDLAQQLVKNTHIIRNKVLKIQYQKNLDPRYIPSVSDLPTMGDEDMILLESWTDQQRWPFLNRLQDEGVEVVAESGHIGTKARIGFKNIYNIDEITGLEISANLLSQDFTELREFRNILVLDSNRSQERFYFEDGMNEYQSFYDYNLLDSYLSPSEIYTGIADNFRMALRIKNFLFKRNGVWDSYSNLRLRVQKNTAKIIFSTPEATKVFYVAASGTLYDFLRSISENMELDRNGSIISLDDYSNTLFGQTDLTRLPLHQLDNGFWVITGTSSDIFTKLQKEGQYIVSYATAKELLQGQAVREEIIDTTDANIGTTLTIPNVRPTDSYEIHISGLRKTPRTVEYIADHSCRIREWEVGGHDDPSYDHTHTGKCQTKRTQTQWFDDGATKIDLNNFSLHIGNEKYAMGDIVSSENLPVVFNNDESAVITFTPNSELLDQEAKVTLEYTSPTVIDPLQVGFVSYYWPSQYNTSRGGRTVSNYPTDVENIFPEYKDKLNIQVIRTGIRR